MGAEMTSAERLLEPLQSLHAAIRDAVVESCARQATEQLAQPAGDEGDTIYAIDRVGEDALVRALTNFPSDEPVCLISEGLAEPLVFPRGAREQDCRWRLLVDPLDGTRGLVRAVTNLPSGADVCPLREGGAPRSGPRRCASGTGGRGCHRVGRPTI